MGSLIECVVLTAVNVMLRGSRKEKEVYVHALYMHQNRLPQLMMMVTDRHHFGGRKWSFKRKPERLHGHGTEAPNEAMFALDK